MHRLHTPPSFSPPSTFLSTLLAAANIYKSKKDNTNKQSYDDDDDDDGIIVYLAAFVAVGTGSCHRVLPRQDDGFIVSSTTYCWGIAVQQLQQIRTAAKATGTVPIARTTVETIPTKETCHLDDDSDVVVSRG